MKVIIILSKSDELVEERDSKDSLSVESNRSLDEQESVDMLDRTLAAFGDHNMVKADKSTCLRKILSGKCDYEGCPYGHRREVLIKGAQDMKAKNSILSWIAKEVQAEKLPVLLIRY